MEKSSAHYKLSVVRRLVVEGRVRLTASAAEGVFNMGLREKDAVDVVSRLQPADLHKSMTTYTDHRIWQDVYHPITPFGAIYLKLTVVDDVLIVSFKVR
ncbi:type II toxin-antitoxin system MqsR family toxin [Cupriavidus campinensis]